MVVSNGEIVRCSSNKRFEDKTGSIPSVFRSSKRSSFLANKSSVIAVDKDGIVNLNAGPDTVMTPDLKDFQSNEVKKTGSMFEFVQND